MTMPDPLRQEIISQASLIVVKVGTRVLTHPDGWLDPEQIRKLAEGISALIQAGRQVVLVSSGAVGAGMSQLGLSSRPTDIAQLQAVAAIGQTKLIEAYDRTFRQLGQVAAQVLLTAEDLDDRARYLNVRNTLRSLLKLKAVPIINENDTVAVDELMLTFGDNDRLAAIVTNLIRAPLLVILSDVAGLYDRNPRDANAQLQSTIQKVDEAVFQFAQGGPSTLSKGGMASKLRAARMATAAGENVIICSGRQPEPLQQILQGEPIGTLFLAQGKTVTPWKRWIGFTAQPKGQIMVDDGAGAAIARQGGSLLAIGVTSCQGSFEKGDVVAVCDASGREIARGLCNYSAKELDQIKGLKSDRIPEVLGHRPYHEVIHRDNMTITN